MPMTVGSSLASVLHSIDSAQWTKLEDFRQLSQLHTKYWGKSMADDEAEWRNTKLLPLTGTLERGSQGEGMDVDTEMDEESNEVSDVTPGCYMLEIGIEGLPFQRLWIRAEYIQVFDYIETYFAVPGYPPGLPPCAVITGQPGIGKTVWIFYALRRYLAEKKPVIWYRDQTCYLFADEGVYEAPPTYKASDFLGFVRTLVDSEEVRLCDPNRLVASGTHHSVIYTTSPDKSRWDRLHKTTRETLLIMNPWSRKEIHQAAQGLSIAEEAINDAFDQFGPTPRLCIDYLCTPNRLNRYQAEVQDAISNFTMDQFERLFEDSRRLTMNLTSHKICLLSRINELPGEAFVAPISKFIDSKLANEFRSLKRADQIHLYERLAAVPGTRKLAGMFFKAAGQNLFQDAINLDILEMVKLRTSPTGAPEWHSSHLRFDKPYLASLESSRQEVQKRKFRLNIPNPKVYQYGSGDLSFITPGALYIPLSPNQVGSDSFILFQDVLYIFQFTISKKHDIKPGLVDTFEKYSGIPPMDRWCFVFVIEPNLHLECPQPRSVKLREGMKLFSAVISFKPKD